MNRKLQFTIMIIAFITLIGLCSYRIYEVVTKDNEEIKDNDTFSNISEYENLNCNIDDNIGSTKHCYNIANNNSNNLYQDGNIKIEITQNSEDMIIVFNDNKKHEFKHSLFGSMSKILVFKLEQFYVVLNMTSSQVFRSVASIFDKDGNLIQQIGYEEYLNATSGKYVEFNPEKKQIIEVKDASYCMLENDVKQVRNIYDYSNNKIVLVDTINVYCNTNNSSDGKEENNDFSNILKYENLNCNIDDNIGSTKHF